MESSPHSGIKTTCRHAIQQGTALCVTWKLITAICAVVLVVPLMRRCAARIDVRASIRDTPFRVIRLKEMRYAAAAAGDAGHSGRLGLARRDSRQRRAPSQDADL